MPTGCQNSNILHLSLFFFFSLSLWHPCNRSFTNFPPALFIHQHTYFSPVKDFLPAVLVRIIIFGRFISFFQATSQPVSDAGSMSDSPQTSPSVSPTPLHPANQHDAGDTSSIYSRNYSVVEVLELQFLLLLLSSFCSFA